MALPDIKEIEIHYLDIWLSNLVDAINYNNSQIEDAVPALDQVLTTIDTVPIQYLRDSFVSLIENLNKGFTEVDDRLRKLESIVNEGTGR